MEVHEDVIIVPQGTEIRSFAPGAKTVRVQIDFDKNPDAHCPKVVNGRIFILNKDDQPILGTARVTTSGDIIPMSALVGK